MSSKKDEAYPPQPNTIGKKGKILMPDGTRQHMLIIGEITHQSQSNPDVIFYLQQLRFQHDGRIKLRLGYYIIGKKGRARGKWVWGQFAPIAPPAEFQAILDKAKAAGWLQ